MELAIATDKVQAWTGEGLGWLVFNQPDRRNAISEEMWVAIAETLSAFERDDAVRVIVVRGAGQQAFASGGDISEYEEKFAGVSADKDARAAYQLTGSRGIESFLVKKPLIALIHGYCFGGGLLVALQADLRLASSDAKFCIPAARLGIGYDYSNVERLSRLVGPSVTADLLFTARVLGAEEAKQVGLINAVYPATELDAAVTALAKTIADNAPLTIRAAKAAIRELMLDPEARNRPALEALVDACSESHDFLEGTRAFLAKRKPHFSGR